MGQGAVPVAPRRYPLSDGVTARLSAQWYPSSAAFSMKSRSISSVASYSHTRS